MKSKAAVPGTVEAFLEALDHPLKQELLALRSLVLGATKGITEQVKWNAPSFCYQGEDRVTFKLHPPRSIGLVFHRGAKVRTDTFSFRDNSGLVRWITGDRGIAAFRNMAEVEAGKEALASLVKAWMEASA